MRNSLRSILTACCLGSSSQAAIVATEVGNNAPGNDADNEYVVILNTGPVSVNLAGYDITDNSTGWAEIGAISIEAGQSLVISSGAIAGTLASASAWNQTIPAGSLFTLATLPTYNNTGTEMVRIRDASDAIIYSFTFTPELGDDAPVPIAVELGASGGTGGASITPFSTVIPEPAIALLSMLGILRILLRRR